MSACVPSKSLSNFCVIFLSSESEILHHDKQYEPFYSSFVALSAHYITTVCGQSKCLLSHLYMPLLESSASYILISFFLYFLGGLVPRNQLLSVAAACKVLIEFSLLRLENPDEACAVSQVRLVPFLFCIQLFLFLPSVVSY